MRQLTKEDTAKEKSENLVGRFLLCAAVDLAEHRKANKAKIWPEWSEETKLWWEEIDSRMKEPACLNFDREEAQKRIKEKIDQQRKIMGRGLEHDTSWRVGIVDGLWDAWNIMEDCIQIFIRTPAGRDALMKKMGKGAGKVGQS